MSNCIKEWEEELKELSEEEKFFSTFSTLLKGAKQREKEILRIVIDYLTDDEFNTLVKELKQK